MKGDRAPDGVHGEPELMVVSSSDIHKTSRRRSHQTDGIEMKNVGVAAEPVTDEAAPPYADVEETNKDEGDIHHPAEQDDILTHTIHVDDDPTQQAITVRSVTLGMLMTGFRC